MSCRTLLHKTHGIGAGDDVVVLYGWHPWAGRRVRLHEVIERTSGAVARCSLEGATAPVRLQEVPTWMLDAAACHRNGATRGCARGRLREDRISRVLWTSPCAALIARPACE